MKYLTKLPGWHLAHNVMTTLNRIMRGQKKKDSKKAGIKKQMNNVDNPFINPTIISYCPGLLGLERGLKRAIGSIRTIAYVEIEAFICENILAGMEAGLVDAAPIWCNLKTFNANPFHNKIHGIIGGYPCQPFSVAGNQKGTEDSRHLWPYILRDVKAIGPVWCFFENVRGHLNLGYEEVYRSLSEIGYAVECGIFTAEEVGAPHQRERLFILAIRKLYLAYANEFGFKWNDKRGFQSEIIRNGESMANTNGYGSRDLSGNSTTEREEIKGAEQWEERDEVQRERVRLQSGVSCTELANTNSGRSGENPESSQLRPISIEQSSCNSWPTESYESKERRFDSFPAKPGQQQYSWEAPRTTEPGLGITIDGYNFREDLLRAAGNSVVEQTAEIAFRDLLKKHLG